MSDHQNLQAEESVLGAMMMSEAAIIAVSPIITPDSFYRETHGTIYKEALALWHAGKPVDSLTLAAHLRERGQLDRVGGEAKIAEIAAIVPAASNAAHYADIVRDLHVRRSLGRAGQEIVRISDTPGDVEALRTAAQEQLAQVAAASNAAQSVTATDFMDEMIGEIREAYKTGVRRTGLKTDYDELDDLLLGMWPGQFIILAARPSQGKSTLGLNIAENVVDNGGTAAFFSYEMSREELILKSLGREGMIDTRHLAAGKLTPEQAKRLPDAIAKVKKRDTLFIQDDPSLSLAALTSECLRLSAVGKLDLVVVDYVQLIPSPHAENRQVEVSIISRQLKVLAKKLNIPILALCQMSRAIEGSGRRPVLSDLRESGSLEQDADVVLFLYDESEYDPDKEADGTTEVIVKKNRKGPNETVKLAFNKRWSRFKNLPKGKTDESDSQ